MIENDLDYLLLMFGMTLFAMVAVITIPIWIIPYMIYKFIKARQ